MNSNCEIDIAWSSQLRKLRTEGYTIKQKTNDQIVDHLFQKDDYIVTFSAMYSEDDLTFPQVFGIWSNQTGEHALYFYDYQLDEALGELQKWLK